jgi:glycosyltransferase involved in cell wall biosynthesis
MKVLFLMISYPDVAGNTNMYTDLTAEFRKNGHEVYVAAPSQDDTSTKINEEGGIEVLRIRTLPLFNTSMIRKGIANLLLPYQYKKAIKLYFKNISFDLVVTPTPPITFIETAGYLKNKFGSRIYLILRDIFPQNAKDLGLIKNPFIFRYFRLKEKKLYKIADSIGCMSKKNIEFVRAHNPEVSHKKLHLLPNWIRVTESASDRSGIKPNFDFSDKFVAVFGGNFGVPQKIEFLIDVAEKIRGNKNILFLLIGNGTEKNRVKKMVSDKNLQNVLIMDNLPKDEYLELIRDCDAGLVNLSDKFTIPNIPSRTLAYWSLKLPVLAAVDENTDYGEMLDNCEGGLWSVTGNTESYIANLLFLYNNPEKRKKMGENGFNYLVNVLTTENTYKTIISGI